MEATLTSEIEAKGQAIWERWQGMTKAAIVAEGIEKYGVPVSARRTSQAWDKPMTINIIGMSMARWLKKQA